MKTICIILGTCSLLLGIVGIILPLLPTTPFLLLTATLYVRSSPRLHRQLLNQKILGPYIRNFQEHKAIPIHAKIITLLLVWGTILYAILYILPQNWLLKITLAILAMGITGLILSFKTLK